MPNNEDYLFGNLLWLIIGGVLILIGIISGNVGAIIIGGISIVVGVFNKVK